MHELIRLSTDKEYYDSFVGNCKKHKGEIDINIYNEHLRNVLKELVE